MMGRASSTLPITDARSRRTAFRKAKAQSRYVALGLLFVVGCGFIAYNMFAGDHEAEVSVASRHLLQDSGGSVFPKDLFSKQQRQRGAVILHFIGMMYMFLALAIVCDEFFVPALEVITTTLGISDDVAGATFMAAGGSAPELSTSLIGVFLTKSNVGFGTIVGSAVFNILFVIGVCSVAAKEVLQLTWWPLTRDVTFYCVALGVLSWEFSDGAIKIWESAILLSIYVAYVSFMAYNEVARKWLTGVLVKMGVLAKEEEDDQSQVKTASGGYVKARVMWRVSVFSSMAHAEKQKLSQKRTFGAERFKSATKAVIMDNRFKNARAESGVVDAFAYKDQAAEKNGESSEGPKRPAYLQPSLSFQANIVDHMVHPDEHKPHAHSFRKDMEEQLITDRELRHDQEPEDEGLDLSFPKKFWPRVFYLISAPLTYILFITIPDSRRKRWRKWFPLSFFMSVLWIAVFSYLMVWWATVFGHTFGIDDTIMGLTLLAAGTSVPDLLTSVIVARQGQGDMAVSSSIGSNIFDVCIGLPLPWFLWSAVYELKAVSVESDSLLISLLVLFGMLVAVIVTIAICKWRMTKAMGLTMFVLYFVFLAQALVVEYAL